MDEEGVKSQRDGGKDDLAHLHGQLAHPVSINYKNTRKGRLPGWVLGGVSTSRRRQEEPEVMEG